MIMRTTGPSATNAAPIEPNHSRMQLSVWVGVNQDREQREQHTEGTEQKEQHTEGTEQKEKHTEGTEQRRRCSHGKEAADMQRDAPTHASTLDFAISLMKPRMDVNVSLVGVPGSSKVAQHSHSARGDHSSAQCSAHVPARGHEQVLLFPVMHLIPQHIGSAGGRRC